VLAANRVTMLKQADHRITRKAQPTGPDNCASTAAQLFHPCSWGAWAEGGLPHHSGICKRSCAPMWCGPAATERAPTGLSIAVLTASCHRLSESSPRMASRSASASKSSGCTVLPVRGANHQTSSNLARSACARLNWAAQCTALTKCAHLCSSCVNCANLSTGPLMQRSTDAFCQWRTHQAVGRAQARADVGFQGLS
jgi:hypothetical protein